MKRGFFIIVATLILVCDVWLYFLAQSQQGLYILLFGLVSTIGLPTAITIYFTFSDWSVKKNISKLTKLSQIDELINEAETQEQKYEILKNEYKNLEKIIEQESEMHYLLLRKKDLENKASTILDEFDMIEKELLNYEETLCDNISNRSIERLRIRMSARKEGNIIIRLRNKDLIIDIKQLRRIPIFGLVSEGYLNIFAEVSNVFYKKNKKKRV